MAKQVKNWELVDLGEAPSGSFDYFGGGMNGQECSLVGEGDSPREAVENVLEQMLEEGFDTAGLEDLISAKHPEFFDGNGAVECSDDCSYHVGFRFDEN